jgi:hypothetical protein
MSEMNRHTEYFELYNEALLAQVEAIFNKDVRDRYVAVSVTRKADGKWIVELSRRMSVGSRAHD